MLKKSAGWILFGMMTGVWGSPDSSYREFEVELWDAARSRVIPVQARVPADTAVHPGVVLFSHGYDANKGGSFRAYSYLTSSLAESGYAVLSIQHELPGDPLLSMTPPLAVTRLSNWKRGVENILFVRRTFEAVYPDWNWDKTVLIGHSNGGDMSMLAVTQSPSLAEAVISLDHRRMAVPVTDSVRLVSLRGCDYEADSGVLSSPRLNVIKLKGIRHGDMDDKGTPEQHQIIIQKIKRELSKVDNLQRSVLSSYSE